MIIKERILKDLYFKKKLTQRQLSNRLNVSEWTVENLFKKYKITARSCSEAQKLRQKNERKIPPKSKLIHLYNQRKLSSYKLAKIFNVSSRTILNWLIKYKISRRSVEPEINFNKTPTLSYILGVICGDGSVYNYKCGGKLYSKVGLGVTSKQFALSFFSSLGKIGFNPNMTQYRPKHRQLTYYIQANSKKFVE